MSMFVNKLVNKLVNELVNKLGMGTEDDDWLWLCTHVEINWFV